MHYATTPDRHMPIRYIALEIWVIERGLLYRRDFPMTVVGQYYVTLGIEQALLKLGVLKTKEYYRPIFFARDDDLHQFEREHIPMLEKRAASLVELVPSQDEAQVFPFRDPKAYGKVTTVGKVANDDILIYLRKKTMEQLLSEAKASEEVEVGGILVGNVFESRQGRHLVDISDLIVSEHTVSSVIELRYTFESWQARKTLMREKFPGKQIVGWYHTHLVEIAKHMDIKKGKVERTTLFFSKDDVFLHKQFFPEKWYIAMVMDPWDNSIFFQWKGQSINVCHGYAIYDELGVAK